MLQSLTSVYYGGYQHKSSMSHRDEAVINRLRIDHTRCTHSYLLSDADQPKCTICRCPLSSTSLLNILILTILRYFIASSMEELFRTVDVHNFLKLIKQTHFYRSDAICCPVFACPSICHIRALYPHG